MKIKMSFQFVPLLFMYALSCSNVLCDDHVVTPPAQVRLPEHALIPSGNTVVRSNQEEEFTEQDADALIAMKKGFQRDEIAELVADGVVLPMQNDSQPLAQDTAPTTSVVPECGHLLQQENESDAAIVESQWIIDAEQQECLSIDSKEAKTILEFVKKTCDDPSSTVRMSLNGRDMLAFLTMTKRYAFDPLVLDTGLRRFFNKLKACLLIDDAVLHQVLPELSNVLEPYLDYEKNVSIAIGFVQRDVEQLMCECFLKYSHMLSERPNDFITKLSRSVARTSYMTLESDENPYARTRHDRDRLRTLVVQLLNLMLDRVAWPPHAFESIWPSFVKIGSYLCDFAQKNVVTHMDDFKDLYTTLVQRFIFYVNLHSSVLPRDFFRVIQNDLSTGVVFFLEYAEHADLKKYLEEELNATLLRSIAFERMELAPCV